MNEKDKQKEKNKKRTSTIARYARTIDNLFNSLCDEAAKLGKDTGFENDGGNESFSFDDYPETKKKADKLFKKIQDSMQTVIMSGISLAWEMSTEQNDDMIKEQVEEAVESKKDTSALLHLLQVNNSAALQAFQQRKTNGMNLSDRVWNLTSQMRAQIEMAIGQGLSKGKSAQNLSREVRQCLKEPDMMYRRYHMNKVLADGRKKKITEWRRKVVDENGKVRFVKQQLEQTGRGVYRSSYKNAMRLTRTEINLAYHHADWEYWNSSNTVIGIMVSLSNNHTLNGKPFVDICDRFDKQRFPKWFKFTGWHPQCRCIATPISPNRKELIEYLKKVRDGEDVSNFHFTGEVTELPATFTDWMKENAERLQFMQAKGRLPYFVKENFSKNLISEEKGGIKGVIGSLPISSREARKNGNKIYSSYDSTPKLSKDIKKNANEVKSILNNKSPLKPRDFYEADDGIPNSIGGDENCVNSTFANELLRRGIKVTATEKYVKEVADDKINELFLSKKGKPVYFDTIDSQKEDAAEIIRGIEKYANAKGGRYFIAYNERKSVQEYLQGVIDKKDITGHIISAECTPKGIVYYDHQGNEFASISAVLEQVDLKWGISIIRVDNKIINIANQHIRDIVCNLD